MIPFEEFIWNTTTAVCKANKDHELPDLFTEASCYYSVEMFCRKLRLLVTGVAGLLVLALCRCHLYLNLTIHEKYPGNGRFSVMPAYVSYHERRN